MNNDPEIDFADGLHKEEIVDWIESMSAGPYLLSWTMGPDYYEKQWPLFLKAYPNHRKRCEALVWHLVVRREWKLEDVWNWVLWCAITEFRPPSE
jgi:hypothetical protein